MTVKLFALTFGHCQKKLLPKQYGPENSPTKFAGLFFEQKFWFMQAKILQRKDSARQYRN